MKNEKGFTLIELMLVISIIGILASIALPNFTTYRNRAYITEGYQIFSGIKENIRDFYETTGYFPKDNNEAGLPEPENIKGKYVNRVNILNGVTYIEFNKDLELTENLKDHTLVIKPGLSKNNSSSPVFFIASKDRPEDWMKIIDN